MSLKDLSEGLDYVLTPEGKVMWTAGYLWRRGYCCRGGCRQCPYGFKKGWNMSNLDGKAQKPEPLTGVHLEGESLQERYSPQSICFGCGPANAQGLHVRSFPQGVKMDELPAPGESPAAPVVARFIPQSHHQAFPGMLNGGIIGALLDCHSNWTAAWTLMRAQGQVKEAPCTVTADFHVKLLRPTPANTEIQIEAIATEMKSDRARIEARLFANGKLCATCTGTFVQVKEGHPAYHRW